MISNPFSTTSVKPGVIEYIGDESCLSEMIRRWKSSGWRSQIVGPHGVGKTTLTYTLLSRIPKQFGSVQRLVIRDGGNVVRLTQTDQASVNRLLIVDGMERVGWLHRRSLIHYCKLREIGLLVTAHEPISGLPVITTLQPSLAKFRLVVKGILARDTAMSTNPDAERSASSWSDSETIERVFLAANGNVREALMLLFDVFETQNA